MIKIWEKLGLQGTYLNKGSLQQAHNQYLLEWREIPLKSETIQDCPLSPYLFKIILKFLVRLIRQLEEIKGDTNWKEVKVFIFVDDMRVYISDPKHSARKFLQLINTFSKVAGYKITSQNHYSSRHMINCPRIKSGNQHPSQ